MKSFLEDRLSMDFNGEWEFNEVIAALILFFLVLLAVVCLVKLIKKTAGRLNPRKDTIFSHRKNRYKNSIGKKKKY